MPSNMAMKRPHARIILIDLEDDVSGGIGVFGGLHPDGVAALGVGGVGDGVGVFAEAFCEDVPLREFLVGSCGEGRREHLHVVTVHVHRMTAEGKVIVHHQTYSLIGTEVHHIVLFRKIEVSQLCFQKHRVVVVASETDIVDKPEVEVGLVGTVLDDQVFGR